VLGRSRNCKYGRAHDEKGYNVYEQKVHAQMKTVGSLSEALDGRFYLLHHFAFQMS
jgi:hypothetical protein